MHRWALGINEKLTSREFLYPPTMLVLSSHGRPWISVPSLGRVSSGDDGFAEEILRDPLGKFLQRLILQRPVRATLVILLPPDLDVLLGFAERLEPVYIQAFSSQGGIERFHMRIVCRLAGS